VQGIFRVGPAAAWFALLLCPALGRGQNAKLPEWSYSGKEGPKEWAKLGRAYAECAEGKTESPIDIKDAAPAALPALVVDYKAVPLAIVDSGHTVEVPYPAGSTLTVGDATYTLKQFHFHHPSEEHLDGKAYPLVAHLVHSDADGHTAVVAVLFDLGAPNPLLDTLWKNIPAEKEKEVDVASISINAADLLPADHGYFTYMGSLTTPPCTEGVTWYVLKAHATISKEQLEQFRKLYSHNARPIQPTNGRPIQETK
jgi:carbonic anhydrase